MDKLLHTRRAGVVLQHLLEGDLRRRVRLAHLVLNPIEKEVEEEEVMVRAAFKNNIFTR